MAFIQYHVIKAKDRICIYNDYKRIVIKPFFAGGRKTPTKLSPSNCSKQYFLNDLLMIAQ